MKRTRRGPRRKVPVRPRRPSTVLGLVGAILVLGACGEASIPGYQVQGVPEGFVYSANVDKEPAVFPDRVILGQGAWLGDIRTFEPQSEIVVTRYGGSVSFDEARAARDVQAGRYGNPASIDYGDVVPVTIDGRSAFAWLETRYDEYGAVRSMDYKTIIPYDTLTYALEFSTSEPVRLHPDSLVRVLHSWGEG